MRPAIKLALLASGAAAAGGAVWLAKDKILVPGGRPGSCAENPIPMPSKGAVASRVAQLAPMFQSSWKELTGTDMPPAALEIAMAQGILETGLGTWWLDKTDKGQGDMRGSGNLGARQCGAHDAGGDYYTCVPYGDSAPQPDGTQKFFDAAFRYYKPGMVGGKSRSAEEAGVYDFLNDLVHTFPAVEELRAGDVLGYAMRQGPKYNVAEPSDQKVFGRPYGGGNGYYGGFGDPKRPPTEQMEVRVGGYGRAIVSHLPMVAAALGHKKIQACIAPELLGKGKSHAPATAGIEAAAVRVAPGAAPRTLAAPAHRVADWEALKSELAVLWSHLAPLRATHSDVADAWGRWHAFFVQWNNGQKHTEMLPSLLSEAQNLTSKYLPARAQHVAGVALDGVAVHVIAAIVGAAAAAGIGWAISAHTKEKAEEKASEILKTLRKAGFDYIDPGGKPANHAHRVESTDPELRQALAFLGDDKRDAFLREMAAKGFGFQKRMVLRVPPKKPGAAPAHAPLAHPLPALDEDRGSLAALQTPAPPPAPPPAPVPSVPAAVLPALDPNRGSLAPAAPVLPPLDEDRGETLKFERLNPDGTTTPLQGEADVTAGCFYCGSPKGYARRNGECVDCHRPWFGPTISGEADVTPEDAAASDAYARAQHAAAKASVEGAGTVAAVVAGGLVAGALAAAGLAKAAAASSSSPEPATPAPVPSAAPAVAPAPKPKSKGALPSATGKIAPHAPAPAGDIKADLRQAEDQLARMYAQDASAQDIEAKQNEIAAIKAKMPMEGLAGFDLGDALQALYQVDALPRARVLPGTGGASVVWYLPVGEAAAALKIGARSEEPDDVDKALSHASDVADITSSLVNAVAAGKRIAERAGTQEDPKCRKIVRQWVEKHPLLVWLGNRAGGPDLKQLAGAEAPAARFVEAYEELLGEIRAGKPPDSLGDCTPTPGEDRAVLGALIAPLGLTPDQEQQIYTAASRTVATGLNVYSPGAGEGAAQAADAFAQLFTGKQWGPPKAAPAAAAHPAAPMPHGDPCGKVKGELQKEKDLRREFTSRHRWTAALLKPDLRKGLAGLAGFLGRTVSGAAKE